MAHPSYTPPVRRRATSPVVPVHPTYPAQQRALADAAVRELGAAPPPAPRQRYYANTDDGRRFTTRSIRNPSDAMDVLRCKAGSELLPETPLPSLTFARQPRHDGDSESGLVSFGTNLQLRRFEDLRATTKASTSCAQPLLDARARTGRIQPVTPPKSRASRSPRISDSAAVFLQQAKQRELSRSIVIDALWTLRIFAELVGDKPVSDITFGDADLFQHALSVWPPHASKRREYRLMAAPLVVAKAKMLGSPGLSLRTQQKHIDRLRTFFRWLEQRGEVIPGLLKGVRLYSHYCDIGRHREPFSENDLQLIFETHVDASYDSPHMYWAPLLGLYQGMRVNECGQLYVDDIQCVDGMPCIDITRDRPGQRLKNRQSRRLLPIHPVVQACGFLDFVEQARRWKRATLFPGLTWGVNGPGDSISDWFNRSLLRKRCGILAPTRTFHSFRHCFATYGERSRVPDARLAILLGHSSGQSILRTHYVKHASTFELIRDLSAIKFPSLEHASYDPERYEKAFHKAQLEESRPRRLNAVYGTLSL